MTLPPLSNERPRIITQFDPNLEGSDLPFYACAVRAQLQHFLPPEFFQGNPEEVETRFLERLPLVGWTSLGEPPFSASFYMICAYRPNAYRFFCEMVTRWLIPGRRINAEMQFAVDFILPELGDQLYIGGEVRLQIENAWELSVLKKNLPIIETELRLGIESEYHACRILEIKGLTTSEKTAMLQENIAALVKRRPMDFDFDILTEMQHVMVLCKENFKTVRSYRHMSRLIVVHYLFRRALKLSAEAYPERRYVSLKLIHAVLPGERKVLGLAIGLSFLRENEQFEARHILNAVRTFIPDINLVEGSFFVNQSRSERILTLYLEVERSGGSFSRDEVRTLKLELGEELKRNIEQSHNALFMSQNEEEVMRHILILKEQLRFVRDLPQVVINFKQQTHDQVEFLVILVRILKGEERSIASLFERRATFLEFHPDRTREVGALRRKYPKEANVFTVRLSKRPFLRRDHSVDLYKARQAVSSELGEVIGDFRDYNGGTLSKETELFNAVCAHLGDFDEEKAFLVENFFFALTPAVMRSVLPAAPLAKLFHMLLEAEEEGLDPDQENTFRIAEDTNYFYMTIVASDGAFRLAVDEVLTAFSWDVVTTYLQHEGKALFGLLYRVSDLAEALKLQFAIERAVSPVDSIP